MALPDFPSLKDDISTVLMAVNKEAMNARLGPLAQARKVVYHEGDRADYSTVQGEIREMPDDLYQVETQLTLSDLPNMSHEQILKTMALIGISFADQLRRTAFAVIGDAVGSAGNITAGALDAKKLLEIYDGVEFTFDEAGAAHPIDVMGSPELEARFREVLEDDEFKAGYQELLNRKREEWRARQGDRKLVD